MIYEEIINKIREVEADGTRNVTKVLVDRNTKKQIECETEEACGKIFWVDNHMTLIGIPIEGSPILYGYNVLWTERRRRKTTSTFAEAFFDAKQKELDETKEELKEVQQEYMDMVCKYNVEKERNIEYMKQISKLYRKLRNSETAETKEEIQQLKHMILKLGDKLHGHTKYHFSAL